MRRTILLPLSIAILAAAFGQSPQPAAPSGQADAVGNPLEKMGTLVVLVTWGDMDKTPADDVYVEAHGFVPKYREEKVIHSEDVKRWP